MTRPQLTAALAERIVSIKRPHPVRVAVTGIDASGKTTLADELACVIGQLAPNRPVIRASIDYFQNPRSERYRRGAASPAGYYEDAFNFTALLKNLLLPLGPGGTCCYRTAVFDYLKDEPISLPVQTAGPGSILLCDGVFLLRPEIVEQWDLRIFVQVDFEIALRRACQRDLALFGSAEAARLRYETRYLPGQRLHLERDNPVGRAEVVVVNDEPEKAFVL